MALNCRALVQNIGVLKLLRIATLLSKQDGGFLQHALETICAHVWCAIDCATTVLNPSPSKPERHKCNLVGPSWKAMNRLHLTILSEMRVGWRKMCPPRIQIAQTLLRPACKQRFRSAAFCGASDPISFPTLVFPVGQAVLVFGRPAPNHFLGSWRLSS